MKQRNFKHTRCKARAHVSGVGSLFRVWASFGLKLEVESHVNFMDSEYKRNRAFFDSPYLLTRKQQQHPIDVFHSFFDCMHLYQVREWINEVKEALFVFEPKDYQVGPKRSDVFYTLRRFEEFVEAAYIVARLDIAKKINISKVTILV